MSEPNYWQRMRRRSMSRRSLLKASARAGVGAAGLALVGCGDDDDDDQAAPAAAQAQQQQMQQQAAQQADQAQQQEAQAQQQQQAAVAQAADDARYDSQGDQIQTGGVFKRAAGSQLTLIRFPWNSAGNNGTIDPTGYMYNSLTQYGGVELTELDKGFSEYQNPDFSLYPDVAQSWETPDDLTWIFNIRADVMFHDGKSFVADHASHSYEAIRDTGVSGGGSPAHHLGKVIGGTEAIDDLTFRLNLSEGRGFVGALSAYVRMGDPDTTASMTTVNQVSRNEEAVLIGTGPWRFDTDSYDPNTGWRLLPFAEGHMGPPEMDEINFTIFSDADAIGIALEAGDIDSHNGIPFNNPETIDRMIESDDHWGWAGTSLGGQIFRFAIDVEPTIDPRARQGVWRLVDQERVVRDFFGPYDQAGRLHFHPGTEGYIKELDVPNFDPAEGAKLLDAAGVGPGSKMLASTLPIRPYAPALAQLLQAELAELDIELELEPTEYNVMIEKTQIGIYGNFLIGFGNWIRPESPALSMIMQCVLSGETNARRLGTASEPGAIRDRPQMSNYSHWLDMIDGIREGTFDDWQLFNETYHEVMFSQVIARQRGAEFYTSRVHVPDPGPTTPNPQNIWLEQDA